MVDPIQRVEELIDRNLDDVPNSCLRLRENQGLFLLLTFRGNLEWHRRINELHFKVRVFRDLRRCCWCDWKLIAMKLAELVDHLLEVGPYDQSHTPTT